MGKDSNHKASDLHDLLKLSREYASSVEKFREHKDSDNQKNPHSENPAAKHASAAETSSTAGNSLSAGAAAAAGESTAAAKPAAAAAAMPPLKEELVLWTAVAGLYYHLEDEEILESLVPGTELLLFREPDNEHDPWAIMVTTKDGQMLGYVTRFKNETIARMMDYGYRFRAQVESEEDLIANLPDKKQAPTEDERLPFTIWLISEA